MKLLAFDTSGTRLLVGVFDGDRKLAGACEELDRRHSAALVPNIQKVLKKAHVRLDQIDVIAPGLGPGSFTGLRVGVTTAKLLAYTLGARLAGVPTFEAIALAGLDFEGRIVVTADAKKGNLYTAIYESDGKRLKTLQSLKLSPSEIFIQQNESSSLFLGAEALTIENVATVGLGLMKNKKFADPFRLEPLYLYAKDCNVTRMG